GRPYLGGGGGGQLDDGGGGGGRGGWGRGWVHEHVQPDHDRGLQLCTLLHYRAAQHHSDVDQQRPSHAHHNQRRYRVGQRPARRERHVPAPIHDGGELSLSLHEPYIPLPRLRGHHRRHPVISASGRSSAP